MKKIGVSQKAVIINGDGKILVIHRTSTAPSNPNKWDFPGGEIDFGEKAIESIIREIKEETGLEISDIKPYDVESHIDKNGEFWTTIAYKTKTSSENIILSEEHDEFRWVTKEEFMDLDCSERFKQFVTNLD